MLGEQDREQLSWALVGPLRQHIPDDHLLVRIDAVLDLSWLRGEVEHLYSEDQGRPSIAPESALRLMLAGALLGIVHDRALMRAAQDSLSIRWFAGYDLKDPLPDHSSLTRIRQRWGEELFHRVLTRTIEQCIAAGLVGGSTVHVDSTLMRANASLSSFLREHVEAVVSTNAEGKVPPEPPGPESSGDGSQNIGGVESARSDVSSASEDERQGVEPTKRVSRTDPDAQLTRKKKGAACAPAYKVHCVADDEQGVVVDVRVTRAEVADGHALIPQLDAVSARTGTPVRTAIADGGYGHAQNYAELEARGCLALIPSQGPSRHRGGMPAFRFKHDAHHDVVRCPRGAKLTRCREHDGGVTYKARVSDCSRCSLRARCVPPKSKARSVLIIAGHSALVRARRAQWRGEVRGTLLYGRRFFLAEGIFAWAKREFGLGRAMRRGLGNVAMQAYLAFAALNLRKLGAHWAGVAQLRSILGLLRRLVGRVWLDLGGLERIHWIWSFPAAMAGQPLTAAPGTCPLA